MRKSDPLSLIMANLLFKSLNISMEQYIQKVAKGGSVNILGGTKGVHQSHGHTKIKENVTAVHEDKENNINGINRNGKDSQYN